jgi:hypothetical protein
VLNSSAFFYDAFELDFLILAQPNDLNISLNSLSVSEHELRRGLDRPLSGVVDIHQNKILGRDGQRDIGSVFPA